jgi:hypothetical protein
MDHSTKLPANSARAMKTTKMASAIKNRILAIPAVADDTPEKPKKPATSETTKKMSASFSMLTSLGEGRQPGVLATVLIPGEHDRTRERLEFVMWQGQARSRELSTRLSGFP